MLKRPPFSGAPHPALYLVAHNQRSMRTAEGLGFLVKIVCRIIHPFSLDWFKDKRGYIPFFQKLFQPIQVAKLDPCNVGQEWSEPFLKIATAGHR